MIAYAFRKLVYALAVLVGVNLITFALFFAVNTPDDMARLAIGGKYVSTEAIQSWKAARGYDVPLIVNGEQEGMSKFTETVFFRKSAPLLALDFGMSESGRSINHEIARRAGPSLALAVPSFILGVMATVVFSLVLVALRGSILGRAGVAFSIGVMSVSSLFYIVFGQWLFAQSLKLVPVSGFEPGPRMALFLILPVLIAVFASLGSDVLLYRSVFIGEMQKDYVRTARAKGAGPARVLFNHVLRNAMLPILTGTVAAIPMLFMGSLVMESFFGIPGLGSYTIDAIAAQDFTVVRAMVFLGTLAYVAGLIATDIAYAAADPRIRLR